MNELRECPFCGEKDSICRMYVSDTKAHFVRCMMCRTDTCEYTTEWAAIAAWNRRAKSPAVQELVDAGIVVLNAYQGGQPREYFRLKLAIDAAKEAL